MGLPLDLYAEEIISHYEHPHNRGEIKNPSISVHEYNPTCGDDITIYLDIEKDKIKDVKFSGVGCAISIASASMLTDFVKGKSRKYGLAYRNRASRNRSRPCKAEVCNPIAQDSEGSRLHVSAQGSRQKHKRAVMEEAFDSDAGARVVVLLQSILFLGKKKGGLSNKYFLRLQIIPYF
jgi:SUF system NifU family Fe-S assembly protein